MANAEEVLAQRIAGLETSRDALLIEKQIAEAAMEEEVGKRSLVDTVVKIKEAEDSIHLLNNALTSL